MKKTLPNIIFLVAVNLLVKPLWLFGIDRVVQNQLGEAVFGAYFALFNFTMIFQIILDFGIQNFNSREISQDPSKMKDYLPNLITAKMGMAGIYFLISAATFLAAGYSFAESGRIFLILLTNQVLISFIYYLRSNIAGLHRFRLDAFFSVFDKILMIVIAGIILYTDILPVKMTIVNFVLIQTGAFAANALLLLLTVFSFSGTSRPGFDFTLIRKIIRESFPFALSIFLMSIYLRMDTIMVERMLGADGPFEAGIYAQSYRIIDALNMLGILFANVLLPTYAREHADRQAIRTLMKKASAAMAVAVIPVLIFLLVKGKFVISLLYVNDPAYSGHILSILSVSFAAYCFMHIFSSMLTATGRLKTLNLIFAGGILLNLVSNLLLIPRMGAMGAALTTSFSELAILVLIVLAAVRYTSLEKQSVQSGIH